MQGSASYQSSATGLHEWFLAEECFAHLRRYHRWTCRIRSLTSSRLAGRLFIDAAAPLVNADLAKSHTAGGGWARAATDIELTGSNADGTLADYRFRLYRHGLRNRTNGHDHGADAYNATTGYPAPYLTDGSSQPYSFHPGGFVYLLGDGSVKFFDDSGAIEILADLVTRNGASKEGSLRQQ